MQVKSCTRMVLLVPNSSKPNLIALNLTKMVSVIQEEAMVVSTSGIKSKILVSC